MRVAAIALIALVALTGCSTSLGTPVVAETFAVPDVVGMAGNAARDIVEDAGFEVEWDAGDDFVVLAGNWTVDAQIPAAGSDAEAGETVILAVSKPEPEPVEVEATSAGLTATPAQAACDMHGQEEFPYGFDGHWVLGKLAEEITDDEWYFKVEATVTNAFDAEQLVNVECYVGGTNDAPTVTAFLVY